MLSNQPAGTGFAKTTLPTVILNPEGVKDLGMQSEIPSPRECFAIAALRLAKTQLYSRGAKPYASLRTGDVAISN